MLGIAVGVEQADGDRLDTGLAQPRRDRAHLVRRRADGSPSRRRQPLAHLEAQAPRHERRRACARTVVHVRDAQAPQLEHVAEARGRDERGQRAALLEHGVRRHGRAVHDARDRGAVGEPDRVDDGSVVVRRRREELADRRAAVGACRITSVKVPPTSTPIRELFAASLIRVGSRYEISNREPRAYSRVTDALRSRSRSSRASVEDRVAQTLRELIVGGPARPRARRSSSETSRSGSACRRRRSARAHRARARRPRRGRRDRARRRQPADTGGLRGDLRRPPRPRGARGARRRRGGRTRRPSRGWAGC